MKLDLIWLLMAAKEGIDEFKDGILAVLVVLPEGKLPWKSWPLLFLDVREANALLVSCARSRRLRRKASRIESHRDRGGRESFALGIICGIMLFLAGLAPHSMGSTG